MPRIPYSFWGHESPIQIKMNSLENTEAPLISVNHTVMTKDAILKKRYGSLRDADNYIMGKVEAEPSKAKSSPFCGIWI